MTPNGFRDKYVQDILSWYYINNVNNAIIVMTYGVLQRHYSELDIRTYFDRFDGTLID